MSRLINVSDAIYGELTLLKKARGISYTEAIALLLHGKPEARAGSLKELGEWALARSRSHKGKREKTDHDLVAYGVSHDSG
jgi:hypothetical protein